MVLRVNAVLHVDAEGGRVVLRVDVICTVSKPQLLRMPSVIDFPESDAIIQFAFFCVVCTIIDKTYVGHHHQCERSSSCPPCDVIP